MGTASVSTNSKKQPNSNKGREQRICIISPDIISLLPVGGSGGSRWSTLCAGTCSAKGALYCLPQLAGSPSLPEPCLSMFHFIPVELEMFQGALTLVTRDPVTKHAVTLGWGQGCSTDEPTMPVPGTHLPSKSSATCYLVIAGWPSGLTHSWYGGSWSWCLSTAIPLRARMCAIPRPQLRKPVSSPRRKTTHISS